MSNCTKCCSKKALKLTSLTKSCPGDGTNPDADLCAQVQALANCAPARLITNSCGAVKILNAESTVAAFEAEVRAQFGCSQGLVTEGGCLPDGTLKIVAGLNADGTTVGASCDNITLNGEASSTDGAAASGSVASALSRVGRCSSCH